MYKRPSIIVDIDGTIADCNHRLHYIRNDEPTEEDMSKNTDWDAFYRDAKNDRPIKPTVALVKSLADRDWAIWLITGRSAQYREATETWLDLHGIPWDILLMRTPGDHSKDVDIKRKWWQQIEAGIIAVPKAAEPDLVIEDRKRCIEMWREEGLIALQCDKGDF